MFTPLIRFVSLLLLCSLHSMGLLWGDHAIAFVHIGPTMPDYALDACEQARRFNKSCPIYLVAPQKALAPVQHKLKIHNITPVSLEQLPKSKAHHTFDKTTRLDARAYDGLWRFSTERFFYLDELMHAYKIETLFHLENDNMLYVDVGTLIPVLQKFYPGIAVPWMSDSRVVPGFVYFGSAAALHKLVHFLAEEAPKSLTDMHSLVMFRNIYGPQAIDSLPVLMPEYAQLYKVQSKDGIPMRDVKILFNHSEDFDSLFDAAAVGMYLGGISPRNSDIKSEPGFVDGLSAYQAYNLIITWQLDNEGRKVPYASLAGKTYRLNNLHVHCKKLRQFAS